MDQMGIRELKQNASAIIRQVRGGEIVEITDHGHPVAHIVPVQSNPLDQLVAEGRAIRPRGDLLETMAELGLPLAATVGVRLPSEILAEMRADER